MKKEFQLFKFIMLSLFALLLHSCKGADSGFAPSPAVSSSPAQLQIAPTSATIAALNSKTFTATGGTSPYTYSIFLGSGSILSTTGVFTAPGAAGTTTVRVTDSLGSTSDAIVTINPSLQINPISQSLTINATQTFTVAGGVSPFVFFVASGVGSIDSATGIYTAPSSPGSAVVRVTDSIGNVSDAAVSVFAALGISPTVIELAVNNTTTFSAAGGSSPYTFSLVSGGGVINSSTGIYTAPALAGSARIRVTDSLGATADSLITINAALTISPTSQTVLAGTTIAFAGSNGVLPYTYSILSGTGSINNTTGDYTAPGVNGSAIVRVTDNFGNTADANLIITTPMSINPASVSLAVNNTTTFTVVGGTGPFTFTRVLGTGTVNASTGVYTAPATSGSATIRVTDSLGATDDALVTVNPALTISPVSQTTLINSTISFSGGGGVSPYSFSLISGTGSINTSTGLYTAPASNGSDVVRITDSLGNVANATVTITTALTLSPNAKTLAVNNTFTFVPVGGTGPFTFSKISGTGVINASTGVYTAPAAAGSAVVRVTDSLGATDDSYITVNAALAISPTAQTTLINSTINFSETGGVSPYTYSVNSGTGTVNASTGVYTAPAANGTAVVRVTDSIGNFADANVTITTALTISPASITLAVNNTTTFSAVGGTGPFTFSLFSGTGSVNAATGVYTAPATSGVAVVRVTDSLGATANANITVNAALAISPTTQTMGINGTLNLSASGGVLPYVFSIFSGTGSVNASTGVFTAPASAGTTVVRVTDAYGNTANSTITVTSGLSISPASITLAVNNTATFVGSNGATPYTYAVIAGTGTINSATGLYTAPATSGTATIRVTDNLGATATASVTINPALAITPSSKTLAVNNVFTFSATGGVSPYTYSIFSGGGVINTSTGAYTAPATTGVATVQVTDGRGNISSASVTVNAALAISPASQTTLINSTISFSASGGVSPYSYSVFSGAGTVNSATGVYTAPAANGTAVVRVTDSIGNVSNSNVTITTTLTISPSPKTLAVNNTTTFSGVGGTSPFTFSVLSGVGSINASTGLYTAPAASGTAVVRVTDSLGAIADSNVTINAALAISPASQTTLINSTINFTASGGVSPFTYSVATGSGTINSATGVYTAPAANGTAVVRVTDSLGNTADSNVIITTTLTISPSAVTLAVNNTMTFSAVGGTGPFVFSIAAGTGTVNSASGLYTAPASSGTATVRVTDSLGAMANATVTINAALLISPLTATIASTGTQAYSSTGGVSPFVYSIVSGPGTINSSTGLYSGVSAGSVTVRVTDSLGNTSDAALTVNGPLTVSPTAAYVVINSDLAITATGGVSPYTFTIFAGAGIIDAVTGVYTAPATTGTATLRTTDAVGATADTAVTIYNALTLSPLSVTLAASGTQTFTATGGFGTRTFSKFSGTGTINSSTGLYTAPATAGTELIQVADTIGNVVQAQIRVVSSLSITPNILKLPVFSSVTFTAILGTTPYTFSVPVGSGTINSSTGGYFAPSTASAGTVRVTDAILNTSDAAVTHIEPVSISSGATHSCVLYSEGSVKCWGLGSSGQLGNGATTNLGDTASSQGGNIPFVNLGTGRTAKAISAGLYHTCVILDNNLVKCWGQNTYGQLGLGNTISYGSGANQMGDSLPTVNLGTGRTALKIFALGYHTCAILDNSVTKCWGRNGSGQLGLGDITNRGTAASQMGDSLAAVNLGSGLTATKIAGGFDHTCALLSNSTMKCWGGNRYGQLGYDNTTSLGTTTASMTSLAAINLGTGRTATDITAGYSHSCAVLDNGTAKCWGRNNKGQLGIESTVTSKGDAAGDMAGLIAIPFTSFTPTKIFGGNQDTCAMNAAGNVRCWGLGGSGQLLSGGTANIGRANNDIVGLGNINFGTGLTAASFSMGFYTNCLIINDKHIKCFGIATAGALCSGGTANNLGDVAGELGAGLPNVNH